MASTGSAILGLTITGELRGGRVEEGRQRADGEGHWPDRYVLSVAAGDDVYRIECADEEAARQAVGADAAKGDVVTVPVSVRAAKGYVFYRLRGSAPSLDAGYDW